jgi:PPK2 family polyphosphate:nucleotide phosphotransferase
MKDLQKSSTKASEGFDKEITKLKMQEIANEIAAYQKVLYAQSKFALLIVLQGLDAAGKNGLISSVFRGVNPLGCTVKPFKNPTSEEKSRDFLWRVHKEVPAKGSIQVFNRSHYEDVLVPVVEGWIDQKETEKRYNHINNFENLLENTGTTVLKFYLHISREEQKERLEERKTNPKKFWKHNDQDWETAKKWDKYTEAYEKIFKKCDHPEWNIIPSDQNWYKEYVVAKKIRDTLSGLPLEYPAL